MASDTELTVAVEPRSAPWIDAAVEDGGGRLVAPGSASSLVWTHNDDAAGLAALLAANPGIGWVQLPWAGVEPYRALFADGRVWSCAKGVYADPVAEHALALLLAGFRSLHRYSAATSWGEQAGRNLFDARVTIVGGGGIGRVLLDLLAPFRCEVTVVRRHPDPLDGATRVVGADGLLEALRGADAVVLALPLLPETVGLIGARELDAMDDHAWLVNVARGAHVDTDALVDALASGAIGGAALDVTDPEPLPDGHPLWDLPNVIITPHTGNTRAMARPLLGARITENVRRRIAGQPLVGLVDVDLGY
ncbi:MAG: dihydrofolate reductase [Acidimicrobiales bacterium]|nr:dihydrofolate reductase [Acidimicrobiales bacterium]